MNVKTLIVAEKYIEIKDLSEFYHVKYIILIQVILLTLSCDHINTNIESRMGRLLEFLIIMIKL